MPRPWQRLEAFSGEPCSHPLAEEHTAVARQIGPVRSPRRPAHRLGVLSLAYDRSLAAWVERVLLSEQDWLCLHKLQKGGGASQRRCVLAAAVSSGGAARRGPGGAEKKNLRVRARPTPGPSGREDVRGLPFPDFAGAPPPPWLRRIDLS